MIGVLLPIWLVMLSACSGNVHDNNGMAKSEKLTIGYQSPTAQTWGALIIKHQKLFEKNLEKLEPGMSANVQVDWFDAAAGSVLNNNMIGGKIQLSFLGDMPSLLNGVQGITQPNYKSVLIALDGKGKSGANQAIIVPTDSKISKMEDLANKTVSTPIGSSAHRMLLEALEAHHMLDKVTIVDQSVTVGMQSIEQNKIDAHTTWEPYPSLMEYRKVGVKLHTDETDQADYLTAVVANRDWAEQHRTYVIAFLMALHEAHQFVMSNPDEAADIFEKESKFPLSVCQKMVEAIRFDAAIYEKDVDTLQKSMLFLEQIGKLKKPLDLDAFIDDSYLREAMTTLNQPYLTDKELNGDWVEAKRL
ncbi:ABC transporter substrate-binding protein (plasmid) [Paenibacillus cellulosilyticus]|nr:ABC transporter substrate-binding protein [Paenibacillus cellulosilyticus]